MAQLRLVSQHEPLRQAPQHHLTTHPQPSDLESRARQRGDRRTRLVLLYCKERIVFGRVEYLCASVRTSSRDPEAGPVVHRRWCTAILRFSDSRASSVPLRTSLCLRAFGAFETPLTATPGCPGRSLQSYRYSNRILQDPQGSKLRIPALNGTQNTKGPISGETCSGIGLAENARGFITSLYVGHLGRSPGQRCATVNAVWDWFPVYSLASSGRVPMNRFRPRRRQVQHQGSGSRA